MTAEHLKAVFCWSALFALMASGCLQSTASEEEGPSSVTRQTHPVSGEKPNKYIWILGDSHVGGNYGQAKEHSYQQAIKYFLEQQKGGSNSDNWYTVGTMNGIKYTDYTTETPREKQKIKYTGYPGAKVSAIKDQVSSVWPNLKANIPGEDEEIRKEPDVVMIAAGQNDINIGGKDNKGCTADELWNDIYDLIGEVEKHSTKMIDIWLVTPIVDAGKNCDRKPDDSRDNNRNKRIHSYGLKLEQLKDFVEDYLANIDYLITYNAYMAAGHRMPDEIYNWSKTKDFGDPHEPKDAIRGKGSEEMHPSKSFTKDVGSYLVDWYFYDGPSLWSWEDQLIYHDWSNCDVGGFDENWYYLCDD